MNADERRFVAGAVPAQGGPLSAQEMRLRQGRRADGRGLYFKEMKVQWITTQFK